MSLNWFILITVIVIGLQGFAYKRWALKKVTYDRYFDKHAVFEGESVHMVENIANRKLLPLLWLRLESMIHAGLKFDRQANLSISSGKLFQNHKSLFSLPPYKQIVRRHRVTCTQRGIYKLGSATMTSGDPLGAIIVTKKFPLSLELVVYPSVVALEQVPLPNHSWLGDITVRRWIVEDPFVTAGTREYRYGDTLNSINWKATARTGALQVHKKDYTADHRLIILLNFEVNEQMWNTVTQPELIELGIRYAATLSGYAIDRGIDTGFACNGCIEGQSNEPVRLPAASGEAHWFGMLETMARLELATSVTFDTLLEQEVIAGTRNADLLIISAFVSEKMQRWIGELQALGNGVEVLHLSAADASKPGAA